MKLVIVDASDPELPILKAISAQTPETAVQQIYEGQEGFEVQQGPRIEIDRLRVDRQTMTLALRAGALATYEDGGMIWGPGEPVKAVEIMND